MGLAVAALDDIGSDTCADNQGNRSDIKHAARQDQRKAGARGLDRVAQRASSADTDNRPVAFVLRTSC